MESISRPQVRVICAILAAQAAELRDEIATLASIELDFLNHICDTTAQSTQAIREAAQHAEALPSDVGERCLAAAAANTASAIDGFAFTQAQRLDLVSQIADFLASALGRMTEDPDGLRPAELARSYVSERQRHIHDATLSSAGPLGEAS